MTDLDFQNNVLNRIISNSQLTSMANQLGIPAIDLGFEVRIALAHLTLHAIETSNAINVKLSNDQSNQVLATILSKMPNPV